MSEAHGKCQIMSRSLPLLSLVLFWRTSAQVILKTVNHMMYTMTNRTLEYWVVPEKERLLGADLSTCHVGDIENMPILKIVPRP